MKKRALTIGYPLGSLGTGRQSSAPFNQVFDQSIPVTPADIRAGKCDVLVIWGGADISPSIYGEPVSQHTGADEHLSQRDKIEVAVATAAIESGVPVIGVCRGAQLMCALSGGKLVQHVDNHAGMDHSIETDDGRTMLTSSVHHQMMYPFDVEHELIAWSKHKLSGRYINGVDQQEPKMLEPETPEPEIVFFPHTKALCVQGHPEFMDPSCDFVQYVNNLVTTHLVK